MKYQALTQTKLLHRYLKLPGEFKRQYPQEVILDNMKAGRMDILYITDEGLLINLEEESDYIGPKTFRKYTKYHKFVRSKYNKELYICAICHKNPQEKIKLHYADPSTIIIIHYIHFTQEELWKKYDNVINKVKHKQKLTETEAMDMSFIAKFINNEYKEYVVESIVSAFKDAIIENAKLKMDVGVVIHAIMTETFSSEIKQKELGEMIGMPKYETEIKKIVYEEYGEELNKKDKIIKEKDDEIDKLVEENNNRNKEFKKGLKKLVQMDDLNPEAKKIISTLMIL